jgi:hypothetical protein
MKELDHFYLQQDEPIKGCLLALRQIILSQDKEVTNVWKYGMPFFCYKGKMFCYLWFHKKHKQPYIGIVEGNRFDVDISVRNMPPILAYLCQVFRFKTCHRGGLIVEVVSV